MIKLREARVTRSSEELGLPGTGWDKGTKHGDEHEEQDLPHLLIIS